MNFKCLFKKILVLFVLLSLNSLTVQALTFDDLEKELQDSNQTKLYEAGTEMKLANDLGNIFVAYLDKNNKIIYDFEILDYPCRVTNVKENKIRIGDKYSDFVNKNLGSSTVCYRRSEYIPYNKEYTKDGIKYTLPEISDISTWEYIPMHSVTRTAYENDFGCGRYSNGTDVICELLFSVYYWKYYTTDEVFILKEAASIGTPPIVQVPESDDKTTTTKKVEEDKVVEPTQQEEVTNPPTGQNTSIALVSLGIIMAIIVFAMSRKYSRFNTLN